MSASDVIDFVSSASFLALVLCWLREENVSVFSNNAVGFTADAACLSVGHSFELGITRFLSGTGKEHCSWSCSVESQSFNGI